MGGGERRKERAWENMREREARGMDMVTEGVSWSLFVIRYDMLRYHFCEAKR